METRLSLLARLLRPATDPRESLRPLWHKVVAVSRERDWYALCSVEDSVPGRFDMIVAILALVLLRLEADPETALEQTLLTELFVEDMDGQLRESGVGDLVVGKHIGKLVAALGGRLGAFREALADDGAAWAEAVARNATLTEGAPGDALAGRLKALTEELAAIEPQSLLAGGWAR